MNEYEASVPGIGGEIQNKAEEFTGAAAQNGFSLKKGINISHWLSQVGFGQPIEFEESDVVFLATSGFDYARLPVDEEQLWDIAGQRIESNWAILQKGIGTCIRQGLKVVVDLHIVRSHYFNAINEGRQNSLFGDTPAQGDFLELWRQLSSGLSHFPNDRLAYEILNEPVANDPDDWNGLLNETCAVIRRLEPRRTIVIGSNAYQSADTFPALKVPPHDLNILLSFHSYIPMLLTHYKATWLPTFAYDGPVRYPGVTVDPAYATRHYSAAMVDTIRSFGGFRECNRESIAKNISIAVNRAKDLGLPVQCGEFGCLPTVPRAIRLQYYKDMVSIFQEYHIAYASWDYRGSFSVVFDDAGRPDYEMIAIFNS